MSHPTCPRFPPVTSCWCCGAWTTALAPDSWKMKDWTRARFCGISVSQSATLRLSGLWPAEQKRLEHAPWNTKSDVCFAWHCIVCAKEETRKK